ncbi:MAG: 30S ribosomal protein S4 [Patescibacteria group bacterium]|nr:30S ribosomal protein S4 [Patescibacteria group bacterium]
MARNTGPVCRLCRREGEKLFLKGARCEGQKCALVRKNYIPGAHGGKRSFKKLSEYAKQLREKQKAKRIFGIAEKQFHIYYERAEKMDDITGDALLKLLEERLDNVLYRAGFAESRAMARQLASHGLVKLNGRKVTVPSITLKVGDKFEVVEKSKSAKMFEPLKKKKDTSPKWLEVDLPNLKAEVTKLPGKDDIDSSIESQLIVEFYSK